jgi:hypothetical protein
MYKVLTLILCSLSILSCQKKGPSYVKGTIYERGTNQPIEGASIILDKDKYVLAYGYKESNKDDSTYSDSNGEYKIKFTRSPTARYYIHCEAPGYFTYYDEINQDYKIKHGKTAINFTLIPKAYVKIKFIKTNTNFSYVSGTFNEKVTFSSPYYLPPGTNTTYNTIPSIIYTVYGNQVNTVSWLVSQIGQTSQATSKIEGAFFVAKGDTAIFTIQF